MWQLVSYIRSLSSAARSSPRAPVKVPVSVTTRDGRELRGTRLSEDTFFLHLVDGNGEIYVFDKSTRDARKFDRRSVTAESLANAPSQPQNWLMYWGDYQSTHYSGAEADRRRQRRRLRAAWTFPMPGDSRARSDAAGRRRRDVHDANPAWWPRSMREPAGRSGGTRGRRRSRTRTRSIRSIAAWRSLGNRLFVGTLDAALIALDAQNGTAAVGNTGRRHDARLQPHQSAADREGQGAGRYHRRRIRRARISWMPTMPRPADGCGDGTRFPAPGEFGNDTWKGDSWKTGGGPTWLTGSYDPDLESRLLDRSAIRRRRSIGRRAVISTTYSAIRW